MMIRQSNAKTIDALRAQANLVIGLDSLSGLPVGGWGETQRAMAQIEAALPWPENRQYTLSEAISALYIIDHSDRYRRRNLEVQNDR